MADLSVQAHSEISDVPAVAWAALTARSPASVTGSRAWFEAALATVDRATEPHLLAVRANDRVVALLTLVLDRRQEPKLRFAGAPFNDLTDLMVLPGYEAAAAAAVIEALREISTRGWSIELEDIDPAGALVAGDREQVLLQWERSLVAPTLLLEEEHDARVSPRLRRRWDRALERLNSEYCVEVRFVTGPVMLEDFVEFVRVRDIRLRAKGHNLRDPPPELLEATVQRLAPLERCAFMELHVGGVVVARDLYLLLPDTSGEDGGDVMGEDVGG